MDSMLDEIVRELMTPASQVRLPAQSVPRWMGSSDSETMGAIFSLLHKPEHYNRIVPPLSFDDYRAFHIRYYEHCLRQNPAGTWCDTRYLAAHSLVAWFKGLWIDKAVSRDALRELKLLLARLYTEGDKALKLAIVTGALEHLFEDRRIVRFFSDWKADPNLKSAYHEALGYAD